MSNRNHPTLTHAAITGALALVLTLGLATAPQVHAQVPGADLSVDKTDDPDPVAPGGGLRYDIAVTNVGTDTAADVTVVDTLPAEVSYLFDSDACVEAPVGTLTCALGDLPAGDTTGVSIFVAVDPMTAPGVLLNEAEATTASGDSNPNNNVDDEDTLVDGPAVTPINHALCYEVDQVNVPRRNGVAIADELGGGLFNTRRLKRLCTPVDKNGEDPNAPLEPEHLTGYEIRQTDGRFPTVRDQTVINQFGTQTIDIGRPVLLLVPTAKSLVGPPAPLAPPIDHYQCRRVRGSQTRVSGLSLVDQLDSYTADVKRPYRLCSPADTNGSGIQDPASHLLCYRIRTNPTRPAIAGPLYINNQFDQIDIAVTGTRELCVPTTLVPDFDQPINPNPNPTPSGNPSPFPSGQPSSPAPTATPIPTSPTPVPTSTTIVIIT